MNMPPSRDITGRIAATSLSLTAGGFYSPRQSLTRGDSPSRNQPSMTAAAGGFMVAAMAESAARPAESAPRAGRSSARQIISARLGRDLGPLSTMPRDTRRALYKLALELLAVKLKRGAAE